VNLQPDHSAECAPIGHKFLRVFSEGRKFLRVFSEGRKFLRVFSEGRKFLRVFSEGRKFYRLEPAQKNFACSGPEESGWRAFSMLARIQQFAIEPFS
jgi:hypothetical protein